MTLTKQAFSVLMAVTAILAFSVAPAQAKKPDNPGGGKPGGGGGGSPPRFSVIELPIDNPNWAQISDPTPSGVVTIAIEAPDEGYGSGAFVRVDSIRGAVLSYGFLPEPEFIDSSGVVYENGWSDARDVNASGTIAGFTSTFHPDFGPGPFRATIWTDNGTGYSMAQLPLPAGASETSAFAINNPGDVVGRTISSTGNDSAVFWDAETLTPTDLNTPATAALGWELQSAEDINDDGLIVGRGVLHGIPTSFLLDHTSGDILPVPLVNLATDNLAYRINSAGRAIGWAWDGEGNPAGQNPDFVTAFSWDGPGSDPSSLPSLTSSTSLAVGMNDSNMTVGYSYIPTDEPLGIHSVATLWEPDSDGAIQATDLQLEIPSKPEYALRYATDVNNEGWIATLGRKFSKGRYSWPAVLLVPNSTGSLSSATVPEPSAVCLVVSGLMGLPTIRRRRLQKHV